MLSSLLYILFTVGLSVGVSGIIKARIVNRRVPDKEKYIDEASESIVVGGVLASLAIIVNLLTWLLGWLF